MNCFQNRGTVPPVTVQMLSPVSKMINLSVPDTIDERTINKKKLTPFTIQVRQEVSADVT